MDRGRRFGKARSECDGRGDGRSKTSLAFGLALGSGSRPSLEV